MTEAFQKIKTVSFTDEMYEQVRTVQNQYHHNKWQDALRYIVTLAFKHNVLRSEVESIINQNQQKEGYDEPKE